MSDSQTEQPSQPEQAEQPSQPAGSGEDYYSFPGTPGMDKNSKPEGSESSIIGSPAPPADTPDVSEDEAAEAYSFNMGKVELSPEEAETKVARDLAPKESVAILGQSVSVFDRELQVRINAVHQNSEDAAELFLIDPESGKAVGMMRHVFEYSGNQVFKVEFGDGHYAFQVRHPDGSESTAYTLAEAKKTVS